jgi:DNA-binding response OmpR family regulator
MVPTVSEEILIVNDGSLLLKMVGGLLEDLGYQLSLTDTPEEALRLLSSRNIVLAVIKLNGHQAQRLAVMRMVKEMDAGTRLIIVGDQGRLPAEAFEVEADDYLLLPCRGAEIWRRLTLSLEPPVPQPEVSPEDVLVPPCNHGVLYHPAVMFPDAPRQEAARL